MLTQRPLIGFQKGRNIKKMLFEAFNEVLFEIRLHNWNQRVKLHISSDFYIKILTCLLVLRVLSYVVTY